MPKNPIVKKAIPCVYTYTCLDDKTKWTDLRDLSLLMTQSKYKREHKSVIQQQCARTWMRIYHPSRELNVCRHRSRTKIPAFKSTTLFVLFCTTNELTSVDNINFLAPISNIRAPMIYGHLRVTLMHTGTLSGTECRCHRSILMFSIYMSPVNLHILAKFIHNFMLNVSMLLFRFAAHIQ